MDCTSVGVNTPDVLNQQAHTQISMHQAGTQSVAGEQQPHESFPQLQSHVSTHFLTACAPTHGPCLKLNGGAPDQTSSTWETEGHHTNMSTQYYASTTDLLLQNLSMVVGNPRRKCTMESLLLDVRLSSGVQQKPLGRHQRGSADLLGAFRARGHPTTTRTTPALATT